MSRVPVVAILGIVILLALSAVAFSGAFSHGVVPGWIGVVALVAFFGLLFVL